MVDTKKPPAGSGDTWTSTALDADSKLVISGLIGLRDQGSAYEPMKDLADRIPGRIQLTTDGLAAYLPAVEDVFDADVDFAELIKLYGPRSEPDAERRYSPATCHGTRVNRVTGDPNGMSSGSWGWSRRGRRHRAARAAPEAAYRGRLDHRDATSGFASARMWCRARLSKPKPSRMPPKNVCPMCIRSTTGSAPLLTTALGVWMGT